MNRPVHFEIQTPDPAKTMDYYQRTLGWKFSRWSDAHEYWLVDTGQGTGINGGLMPSRDGNPRTINTIEVANVDEAAAKAQAAGGMIVVPKLAIPGVGYLVYVTEPGGNIYGMMHRDPSAK